MLRVSKLILGLYLLTTPVVAVASDEVANNIRVLREAAAKWQEILSMSSWTVDVQIVRKSALLPNTIGHSDFSPEFQVGVIAVMDSVSYSLDYPKLSMFDIAEDQIQTVIHELVHMKLREVSNIKRDLDKEEAAVVALTNALSRWQDSPVAVKFSHKRLMLCQRKEGYGKQ